MHLERSNSDEFNPRTIRSELHRNKKARRWDPRPPSRGPYEKTLRKVVACVCNALDAGLVYTINKANDLCNFNDPRTLRRYVYYESYRQELNSQTEEKCGRSVNRQKVSKTYDGLFVESHTRVARSERTQSASVESREIMDSSQEEYCKVEDYLPNQSHLTPLPYLSAKVIV